MEHGKSWAITVGETLPIDGIVYQSDDGPDRPPTDSGFTILFSDAPLGPDAPGGRMPTEDELRTVCLDCLIEHHPEIGRGLDLAKQHGAATLVETGEWVPG